MEEVFSRFPYLGQGIFECLDNEDFAKCRKVSHKWKNFIDNEKFSSVKIIKSFYKKPKKSFITALKTSKKGDAKSMASTIQRFCQIWASPNSELHKAAYNGDPKIFKELFGSSKTEDPKRSKIGKQYEEFMALPLH